MTRPWFGGRKENGLPKVQCVRVKAKPPKNSLLDTYGLSIAATTVVSDGLKFNANSSFKHTVFKVACVPSTTLERTKMQRLRKHLALPIAQETTEHSIIGTVDIFPVLTVLREPLRQSWKACTHVRHA